VGGNHFLYSQSIMVIHADTNCCTHLSCLQLMRGHHVSGHRPSKAGQCYAVLGNLVRMHYPDEVTWSNGTISPATYWDDYALASDATYGTANGAVWSDFWVSFLVILFQSFIPDAPDFATV
jgi:hypothetical protein